MSENYVSAMIQTFAVSPPNMSPAPAQDPAPLPWKRLGLVPSLDSGRRLESSQVQTGLEMTLDWTGVDQLSRRASECLRLLFGFLEPLHDAEEARRQRQGAVIALV